MFARQSQSAFICTRCRTKLRLRTINAPVLATSLHRSLSSSLTRPTHDDRAPDPSISSTGNSSSYIKVRGHNGYTSRFPKNGRPRSNVVTSSESLSVNALGEPASVLVLRGAELGKPVADEDLNVYQEKKEYQKSSQDAILRSIEGGKVGLDQNTVNEQIERLRPQLSTLLETDGIVISLTEYERLYKILHDGFTTKQLRNYLTHALKSKDKPHSNVREDQSSKERLENMEKLRACETTKTNINLRHSPWKPCVGSVYSHGMSLEDRKHASSRKQQMSAKKAIVEGIIFSSWGAEIAEELDTVGEIKFTLTPVDLDMFTVGKPSYLDEIVEKRQIKVEVYRHQRSVRLTGNKTAAMQALEDIDKLWSSKHNILFRPVVSATMFPIKNRRMQALLKEDIEMISELTRTVIKPPQTRTQETSPVYHIQGVTRENVHDANRALLTLYEIPTRSTTSIIQNSRKYPNPISHEVASLEHLPHRYRRQQYARLRSPIARKGVASSSTELHDISNSAPSPTSRTGSGFDTSTPEEGRGISAASDLEAITGSPSLKPTSAPNSANAPWDELDTFAGKISKARATKSAAMEGKEPVLWESTAETSISVDVGYVLHAQHISRGSSTTSTDIEISNDTIFLPQVPKLARILPQLLPLANPVNEENLLCFRLIHHAWDRKSNFGLPEIRLEFRVKSHGLSERTAEFKDIYAVLEDDSGHITLPAQAVDLRLRRRSIVKMNPTCLPGEQGLQDFIEQTRSNIIGSGRLRAPPSVMIPMPFRIAGPVIGNSSMMGRINKNFLKPSVFKTVTSEKGTTHHLLANYIFAGVEHTQSVRFEFEGYPLSYHSVEAGRLGGNYGEMTLTASGTENFDQNEVVEKCRDLVGVGLRLVDLVDKGAHGKLESPQLQARKHTAISENEPSASMGEVDTLYEGSPRPMDSHESAVVEDETHEEVEAMLNETEEKSAAAG